MFTYLHLSGVDRELTLKLLSTKTTAIAYESVSDEYGNLPLLSPMSAIAGNMSVTIGIIIFNALVLELKDLVYN